MVDGKETELLKGDIGFLACKVDEGDHTLVLTFHAPGLKEGAVGSLVCWLILAAGLTGSRIRRKKPAQKAA